MIWFYLTVFHLRLRWVKWSARQRTVHQMVGAVCLYARHAVLHTSMGL